MTNTRKVLVVGNEPVVIESLEQVLVAKGCAVVKVATGEEALWELSDGAFDAVFAQAALRGMSAVEAAEEAHTRQPALAFVIVGAGDSTATKDRAAAVGVAERIALPLPPGALGEAIDRVLQGVASAPTGASGAKAGATAPAPELSGPALRLKNVVLFVLAPFIGLFYLLTFPIIGLGMLAWWAFEAKERASEVAESLPAGAHARASVSKTLVMMVAVGFSGVVYAVLGPILGIGLILKTSFEAWGRLGARAIKE